jgi:hypothetical protein
MEIKRVGSQPSSRGSAAHRVMAAAELEAAKNSWQVASADVPDARPRLHVGRVCAGGGIGLGPAAKRHVTAAGANMLRM